MYAATARLIDADTQKVVARGSCKQIPESNVGAPNADQLWGNGAAGMKTVLAGHVDACVASLKRDMLGLNSPAVPASTPAVAVH